MTIQQQDSDSLETKQVSLPFGMPYLFFIFVIVITKVHCEQC